MKLLDKLKNKKLLLAIILLLIGIIITSVVFLNNKDTKNNEKETTKTTDIVLVEKLDFEINSELQLLSLIGKVDNGEIISEDEKVDTSKLGENEIIIKYLNEKQEEKEYTFKITIIDTEKPVIDFKKELSTTAGTKIDLLKDVKVNDNSKADIKATVEGKYNFNKENEYKLKYIAVDSSGNKTEEEFTLKINKKASSSSNSSSSSSSSSNSNSSSNNSSSDLPQKDVVARNTITNKNPHPDYTNSWRETEFYWRISGTTYDGDTLVSVTWAVAADSAKVNGALNNAIPFMPAKPAFNKDMDINALYSKTILWVCLNP